jgi:hypothetical protein
MLIFTLAVCLFLGHVSNATSFTPTCTVPPPETNYVGGTGIRSTMSIIWNCISIFILCTWSIQHLNIPAGRPPTKHFGKWLWWQILDLGTRVKWMVIIILVPEFLIGKGFAEWSATKSSLNLTFNSAVWTETHVRMANLGYFVLDFSDLLPTQEEREAFFTRVEAVRERLNSSGAINCSRLKHRAWALNDTQWNYAAAGHNGVADLPDVSRRQLEALNRVDAMANFLAILQVIYLIIQLIARKVQGVASTQLEIAALAYSATSLFTFILFWDQPQSVQSRYLVKARELPSDRLIRVIANWGPTYVWIGLRPHARVDSELDLAPIPNDGTNQHPYEVPWLHSTLNNYIRAYGREVLPLALGSLLGGTVFGGFHCIAVSGLHRREKGFWDTMLS